MCLARHNHRQSLRHFLELGIVTTDFFTEPITKNIYNDQVWCWRKNIWWTMTSVFVSSSQWYCSSKYFLFYCIVSSFHFYPRDAMLARVTAIATCPSVTSRYCVKTTKASIMISSLPGSPKTLVFWRQISSPNSKGFPPSRGLKQGWGGKIQRFSSFKRQYLDNSSRYGQSYH